MASRNEVVSNGSRKDVDWSKFGLGDDAFDETRFRGVGYGSDGHQPTDANELFAGEENDNPWWKSNFFLSQPVLFGTWDGVFTSCLINIFGVIVFLRSGWIVAQAGIINAVLMVLATVGVAMISVLSAIGICERCRMESGGVYFLLAHVLGSRLGGAIGLLYVFGQAVGCALFVLGFGESVAGLFGLASNAWAQRGFASAAVLLLSVINIAGVKWVVKLQFILLLILLLAGLDFAVGSFIHTDYTIVMLWLDICPVAPTGHEAHSCAAVAYSILLCHCLTLENGFQGWISDNFEKNAFSDYFDGYNWFTVFGVFFPTITGIMAGINMSGDLRNPATDIPHGTLAAVATCTGLYLIFVIFLGATCTREVLKTDFMIAAKVSAFHVLLLAGLYVSSMSSCLGAMYGTPRVLQSIANENVIPVIQVLGKGRGPNRVPIYAMSVVAAVIVIFTLLGDINSLAPIVTMPFLMMYATVDYAYFALAQTFDIQNQREQRFRSSQNGKAYGSTPSFQQSECSSDLDTLFPERSQHRTYTTIASSPSVEQQSPTVHSKRGSWYSSLCNRWLSLIGGLVKLAMMLLVRWDYAVANCAVVFIIWVYVGLANPAVKPGVASQFKFFRWLRITVLRLLGKRGIDYEEIVIPPQYPGLHLSSDQLNEDNEDFSYRQRFHQTASMRPYGLDPDETYRNVQLLR